MCDALRALALLSCLLCGVFCQGVSKIAISDTSVYTGQRVTLTCSLDANNVLVSSATMDALNDTRIIGSLFCSPGSGTAFVNAGEGLFSAHRFSGCEALTGQKPTASVSVVVSPLWELDYKCTFSAFDLTSGARLNFSSATSHITVLVMPKIPWLNPSGLVFNDTDTLQLQCTSLDGVPAADLELLAVKERSSRRFRGNTSVSMMLPTPAKDWHDAEVTCRVVNHYFPNMTASGVIRINYIAIIPSLPVRVYTYSDSVLLNCSADIASYPGAIYQWSIPANVNISASPNGTSPILTVPQGHSGLINCTAVNNVTGREATVIYDVISDKQPLATWIIILSVVIPVVVITILLIILCKLGCFSKAHNATPASTNQNNSRRRDEDNRPSHYCRPKICESSSPPKAQSSYPKSSCRRDDDFAVKENLIHGGLPAQPTDDAECSKHQHFKSQPAALDNRLLIATEGVVANLKHKTLPTTVFVSFADQSCSLDGILVKVAQAVSLPSPPSFQSAALLLRRRNVGVILSELDGEVLTSRSITGETGGKQRDFFIRLASMSLSKRAGDTRIDIMNYGGKDGGQLAKALEDLLKVRVTVSSDIFGVGEMDTRHAVKRTAVGDDYFNRRNLDDVVYTEVGVSGGQPRSQPIKDGDQVLYSEIARHA